MDNEIFYRRRFRGTFADVSERHIETAIGEYLDDGGIHKYVEIMHGISEYFSSKKPSLAEVQKVVGRMAKERKLEMFFNSGFRGQPIVYYRKRF